MSNSEPNFGFEDENLSLIDVSFEDDCLYNSPRNDHQVTDIPENQAENKSVQLWEIPEESVVGDQEVTQSLEVKQQEKDRKKEKYNLRKSLAWDSAFFTSAGVLDPEELSDIIEGTEKVGIIHMLPGIEEDVHRSTDSLSTLATDTSTLETLEDDLFGDIRASIQKSTKAANAAVSHSKSGSSFNDGQVINEKGAVVTQNKLKTKTSPKKPNVIIKGSGKMANQALPNPQPSKSGSKTGESTSSLCKPPRVAGRISPMLTAGSKRASLGANHVKVEKDMAKNSNVHSDNLKKLSGASRVAKLPSMGGPRNMVPKPTPPSKSSLRSSLASKRELATSSSIDSSGSLSSDSSSRHSSNTVKSKIDVKPGNCSSSVSTAKTMLKTTLRNKNQSMSPRISPLLKSATKLSSSISPSSSISEWSSGSSSPTSSLTRRSITSRPSIDTSSCEDASDNGFLQVLDPDMHSSDKCSLRHGTTQVNGSSNNQKRVSLQSGALVHPDSSKPSGLRLPSPKIGYFDGVRSAVCSPSGLARNGIRNGCSIGVSNEAKLGKLQPARSVMAVRNARPASENKAKPPLPLQETSNPVPKVSTASRNGKTSPGMHLKLQNRVSPGNGDKISPKHRQTTVNDQAMSYSKRNGSPKKDKLSPQNQKDGSTEDAKHADIHDANSKSEAENVILQKVGENAIDGQENKLLSPSSIAKELEKSHFIDASDGLAQEKPALDCS